MTWDTNGFAKLVGLTDGKRILSENPSALFVNDQGLFAGCSTLLIGDADVCPAVKFSDHLVVADA